MKIVDVQLLQYTLPFARPFFVQQQPQSVREGLLIRIETEEGVCGYGDIAPLPGFSPETRKEAAYHAQQIRNRLFSQSISHDVDALSVWLDREIKLNETVSSVRCGIEMACLNVLCAASQCGMVNLFGGEEREVASAGLLQGSLREIEQDVVSLKVAQRNTFKLKVGNKNIPLDVQKIELVRRVIDDNDNIRLDANRAWSFDEAMLFAKNAGPDQIEFLEEPFKDLSLIERFVDETGWPVALDESLLEMNVDEVLAMPFISHVVIKPSLIGGLFSSIDIIKKAKTSGKKVVISSLFESGVGLGALNQIAMLTDTVSGLGTLDWFENDVMKQDNIDTKRVTEFDW